MSPRFLSVEDDPFDAELVARTLAGIDASTTVDQTADLDEVRRLLADGTEYDAILCDHNLGEFNSFDVLAVVLELSPDTPMVVVSGAIGEEAAAAVIRRGAVDYVSKDRLEQLPGALERAIREATVRHERDAARLASEKSEAQLRAVFDHSPDGLLVVASNDVCEAANPSAHRILDVADGGLVGSTVPSAVRRAVDATGATQLPRQDGTSAEVEAQRIANVYDARDLLVLSDVTTRNAALRAAQVQAGRQQALAEFGRTGLGVTARAALGRQAAKILAAQFGAGRVCSRAEDGVDLVAQAGDEPAGVAWPTTPIRWGGGDRGTVAAPLGRDPPPADSAFLAALADTLAYSLEREATEAAVQRRALHDPLTGLPNRTLLGERLAHWMRRAERSGGRMAVLFVDLDHFKNVNDALGHPAGDELLCSVAQRLATVVRPGDTLARFGGDEFLVLCEGVRHGREAGVVAGRIIEALREPFKLGGHEVITGASVGIAIGKSGDDGDRLIADADAALYQAKGEGGDRFAYFDESLRQESRDLLALEFDLRRALAGDDEIFVLYQPIVHASTGRVHTIEALARWRHPTRGIVSPAEFIPAAEEAGLITGLGARVLLRALREARDWVVGVDDPPRLNVNVSAVELAHAEYVDAVMAALETTGFPAERLCLEITESTLLKDTGTLSAAFARLRAAHIVVSLDDFGTGYASLANVQRFPISELKVDRAFVDQLGVSNAGNAIMAAAIALGNSMGMIVVAEGVERVEQAEQLAGLGCDVHQGFLYSRPIAAEAVKAFLAASVLRT